MKTLPDTTRLNGYFERLRAAYADIDRAYGEAASHYGFSCEGCTDNCCTQRFFHHTVAEFLYLLEGMKTLEAEQLLQVLNRARAVTDTYALELQAGQIIPLMCPLNFDGLCALYDYRPMICRAHGLPHEFLRPDGQRVEGGGCRRFEEHAEADVRVDRTVFYTDLAAIEKEMRAELGFTGRFKKTTAQMLLEMAGHLGLDIEAG